MPGPPRGMFAPAPEDLLPLRGSRSGSSRFRRPPERNFDLLPICSLLREQMPERLVTGRVEAGRNALDEVVEDHVAAALVPADVDDHAVREHPVADGVAPRALDLDRRTLLDAAP